ncbi:MAG: hypothetical protein KIT09_25120 [Bryobacteraceae bacterium]|nr:hypothetical protein [Bryobacteraceae bacterium]
MSIRLALAPRGFLFHHRHAGAVQFNFPRENAPRAPFAVTRLVSARTGNGALIGARFGELQPLRKRHRPGAMHSGAKGHLYRLQIHAAGLLAFGQDESEQTGWFARDLGLDRFGRFFFLARERVLHRPHSFVAHPRGDREVPSPPPLC